MTANLTTIRRFVRQEVDDPAPLRKPSPTVSFQHDGGDDQTSWFQDSSEDFGVLGIVVGDVIFNNTDGGSLATIRAIVDAVATNDRLEVDSIDGGNENDYDDGDVIYLYDRQAQKGLDGTRFTNSEVLDAINQAQLQVARKFGGVQKTDVAQDIKVDTKFPIDNISGIFVVNETLTGGNNGYTAVIEVQASDFFVVEDFRDAAGNLDTTALFEDNEVLTGNTSGATCQVNSPGAAPALQGYTVNNFNVGQNLPTDLKTLEAAYYWNGSTRRGLGKQYIQELFLYSSPTGSGEPYIEASWDDSDRIWLWPNQGYDDLNSLHLIYWGWPADLSDDTDITELDIIYERLLILLAARILAGQMRDSEMSERIKGDMLEEQQDIMTTRSDEPRSFRQEIKWNLYDESAFYDWY
jgi:hypothetical protein